MARLPRYLQQVVPTGGRRAVAADSGGDRGLGSLGKALGQVEDAAIQIHQTNELRKADAANVKASTELGNFALDLDADSDYETHFERFNKHAEKVKAEATKNVSGDVAKRLNNKLDATIAKMGISVRKSSVVKMAQVGRAELTENLNELAALGGRIPGARDATLLEGFTSISTNQSLGILTPIQAEAERSAFLKNTFLSEIDANPSTATALIPEFQNEDYRNHLDGQDIRALTNAARITQANYEKGLVAHAKSKNDVIQNQFLELHEGGDLTPAIVLSSDLPAFGSGSKDTFLRMLDSSASGGAANPSVFANTMARVLNGSIRSEDEMLPLIGNGLTTGNYMTLRGVLNDPLNEDKKNVLTGAKGMITGSSAFMADPDGDELYMKFTFALDDALEEGEKAGKSRRSMLNPSSKDYIVDDVMNTGPYLRTIQEKTASMLKAARRKEGSAEADRLSPREFLEANP